MADDRMLAKLTQDVEHTRSAQSTLAAMSWNFAPWGTAGVSVGMTEEQNSLLGSTESGALALTSDASTASVGTSVKLDLGDQWTISGSWSMGRTQASPVAGSIVQVGDDDARALACQKPCTGGADARGTAGDECHFAFDLSHACPCLIAYRMSEMRADRPASS
jgi:hypothetical protein